MLAFPSFCLPSPSATPFFLALLPRRRGHSSILAPSGSQEGMSRSSTIRNTSLGMPLPSGPPLIPRIKNQQGAELAAFLTIFIKASLHLARERRPRQHHARQRLASHHATLQVGRRSGVAGGGDKETAGLDEDRCLLGVWSLQEKTDGSIIFIAARPRASIHLHRSEMGWHRPEGGHGPWQSFRGSAVGLDIHSC